MALIGRWRTRQARTGVGRAEAEVESSGDPPVRVQGGPHPRTEAQPDSGPDVDTEPPAGQAGPPARGVVRTGTGLLDRLSQRAGLTPSQDVLGAEVELTGYSRLRNNLRTRVRQTLQSVAASPRDEVVRGLIADTLDEIEIDQGVRLPRLARVAIVETVFKEMIGVSGSRTIRARGDDLVRRGWCTPLMLEFLRACVRARMNIVVSGGASSGRTTMLNALAVFIPGDERIITIEDVAELQLGQTHVVPLETRTAGIDGRGVVSIRDLVINALQMLPDRIIVGECRGAEALDIVQALNTAHDGLLMTLKAGSAGESLSGLEAMALTAGCDLPARAVREQIGSAIDIVIHQMRPVDGTRRVASITEVTGCVDGEIRCQEIFRYEQTGSDGDGRVAGRHTATGVVPQCLDRLTAGRETLSEGMFAPAPSPDSGGTPDQTPP